MAVPEIEGPRRNWGRAAQLGLCLILFGGVALSTLILGTAVPVALIGWALVLSGVAEGIHAFRVRRSDEFLLHLIPAIAGAPIGLLIAAHPAAGAVTWMLLFASFFTIIGLFRVISAFWLKFPNWCWTVFEGIVTLLLGTVMWAAWVWLIPWFFGVAVGISLILRGWSSIMLALGLRRRGMQRKTELRKNEAQPNRRRTSRLAPG
jgi:uncharacterized membrane protein HdeD (DUF308 family)